MWRVQAINEPSHRVLLLATVVRSFGLLPLGLSDVHSHIFCSKHSFAKILVGLSNFKYHKNGTIPNVTNTRISCSVAGATAQRHTIVFISHCASRFLSILWNFILGSWKRLKHISSWKPFCNWENVWNCIFPVFLKWTQSFFTKYQMLLDCMCRFDGVHAILLLSTWIRVVSKGGYVCDCWSVIFVMSLRRIWK